MDIEFVTNFKEELLHMLEQARISAKSAPPKPVVQAVHNTKLELLQRFVIFTSNALKAGEADMEKIKAEIKSIGEFDIEDWKTGSRANSPVTSKIIEIAERLKEGKGEEVDAEGIAWGHFSARVHQMRNEKRIPENVFPVTKEGKFGIVKYTKEQMAVYPQRRKARTSSN